ncbi:hypothetical protein [Streptosporangium sp. NBC_01756]|uniref:hypothetical protein n=1 Tax=Streptosporangium sp. NBC_01756 TaxID=2975950 RepID=UPI002DD9D294|nr:hypothetical protein [Streptosporangium sp. NBC_01756]WSC86773.1 hypothetical protein OIE48_00710 [Streptosporangium sp. NBC_01756]
MTLFVYRSHYEGPLGKRVRRLPDATVLDWFRRGWAAVVVEGHDTETWITAELGGPVYGLGSIFEAARREALAAPGTWQELGDLLRRHLYVEGEVRADELSVRVLTDDDEVELAYFFLDDSLVRTHADRLAYLVHDGWPLPEDADGAAPGPFTSPVPVEELAPARAGGEGVTYAVLLTFCDSESISALVPRSFPGVRLPELAGHLRALQPCAGGWPGELLALRALTAPAEDTIGPALSRCNRWPETEPAPMGDHRSLHAACLRVLEAARLEQGRDPGRSLVRHSRHLAQMSVHMNDFFGHQQWFLFDDVWAAGHADLARSLLRYAHGWDPLDDGELR